ncbi:cysteine desulfurase, putative [Plasmodium ovale]|uniref:cysteine desulfurase n=2 Tax=Plasmodium ovale TaxID=36330 RepID=A0A1A8VIS9_PLAOA|nr:cysteine desulfurase, putative [Plasmodium ovale curtisi]SBS80753.1 cysteine desulfurase, putative [Plasmodium ovale curtisi]SCA48284.1 cysteine desulfurase, putative [Plasmodium ovale]
MQVLHQAKVLNIQRNSQLCRLSRCDKVWRFKKVFIANWCRLKRSSKYNFSSNRSFNDEEVKSGVDGVRNDGVDKHEKGEIDNGLGGIREKEYTGESGCTVYPEEHARRFDDITNEDGRKKISRFYLDSQATTMIDPRVLDKMLPYMTYIYGNAHSRNHFFGWESEKAVEDARKNILNLINGKNNREIIFTSGATESNNLALIGICTYYNKLNNKKNHLITSQIEHKCILQTCRYLQTKGFEVTYLKPNKDGLIKLEDVKNSIKENTIIASFIYVNNEIGVIQDIEKIGLLCKEKNIFFHTDASQAVGKIPIDVQKMNIDLLSMSGHKLYGPKGIGALYIKRKKPNIRLNALIHGGGQERGLRSGTLPTHLIVGLGEAANLCSYEMNRDNKKMHFFFNYVKDYLLKNLDYIVFNGCQINRYYGNMNISFLFVEGESLLMSLNEIALSSGSACTSSTLEPSYVLRSIGISEDIAHTSIRIGFNRFTTFFEVQQLCVNLVKSVKRLRSISPLYEMELEKNSSDAPQFVWT